MHESYHCSRAKPNRAARRRGTDLATVKSAPRFGGFNPQRCMTEATTSTPKSGDYDDLLVVAQIVELRLPPGAGEADRAARVRRLLDASADLSYAVSTYTHRVLTHAGRRPGQGGLRDETIALQDALDAFTREVRSIADAYRATLGFPLPVDQLPR